MRFTRAIQRDQDAQRLLFRGVRGGGRSIGSANVNVNLARESQEERHATGRPADDESRAKREPSANGSGESK